jgi:hypothetical protein
LPGANKDSSFPRPSGENADEAHGETNVIFRQTGIGTWAMFPVGESFPVV